MVNGENRRLAYNLDSFERTVNSCDPTAIEFAANVGADINTMSSQDSARFRVLINRYRDDCTCVRIPKPTRERVERGISQVRGAAEQLISGAEEKAAPTLEQIKAGIAPTLEQIRASLQPTIEQIKSRLGPTGTRSVPGSYSEYRRY